MKAILFKEFGGPQNLLIADVKKPDIQFGQVLIRIKYASVNYLDTLIRGGDESIPRQFLPALPHVPGVEGLGIIEETTDENFRKGQLVAFIGSIGTGAYAEYAVLDSSQLILLPEGIDLEMAAAVPINYLTAFILLKKKTVIIQGDTAMIYAASGGVGTALVQLCKLFGLRVIALERRESKLVLSKAQGVDLAVSTASADWKSKVRELTVGIGVNHIFNSIAGNTLKDDLDLIAPHGNLVVYGMLGGVGEINLLAESFKHFAKSPSIHFSELYSYFGDSDFIKNALLEIFKWLQQGLIAPVTTIFPAEEASQVHSLLENGKIHGKALLRFFLKSGCSLHF